MSPVQWDWGAPIPRGASLDAVTERVNARMRALAGALANLTVEASAGTVDDTARAAALAAQNTANAIGARFDAGGNLITGVGRVPAAYLNRVGSGVFMEVWDELPLDTVWLPRFTETLTRSLVNGGVTAGKALRVTGRYHAAFAFALPFDPSRLYRLRGRFKLVSGASAHVSLGVEGVEADGLTIRSTDGGAPTSAAIVNQHLVTASNALLSVAGTWVEFTGWFRAAGAGRFPSPDPLPPSGLHSAVRYLRPVFYIDAPGATVDFDYLELELLDEEQAQRAYSTLKAGGSGLQPNTVDTSAIQLGAVTASRITVGTLSALTADLGTVTTGRLAGVFGYLDFSPAVLGEPFFINTPALVVDKAGNAVFSGVVAASAFTAPTATFRNALQLEGASLYGLTLAKIDYLRADATVGASLQYLEGSDLLAILGTSAATSQIEIHSPGVLRLRGTGTGAGQGVKLEGKLGFYNTTPAARPTVTGGRGGNAALASLLAGLAALGLIVDSSS